MVLSLQWSLEEEQWPILLQTVEWQTHMSLRQDRSSDFTSLSLSAFHSFIHSFKSTSKPYHMQGIWPDSEVTGRAQGRGDVGVLGNRSNLR